MKEFDATVIASIPNGVVLDKTVFYPGGGGQPSDTGRLVSTTEDFTVGKMSRSGDQLIHELDGDAPAVGTLIHGIIDWERRYQLMRTHTALHILSGVVWRDFKIQVTGGDMRQLTGRMDFEFNEMSADFARSMQDSINLEVQAARPVKIGKLSREEAFKIPDLVRTKINLLPPKIQEVRTVNIVGLDLQADGGTHVNNTKAVGAISIIGYESKGRFNKRMRIALEA